MFKNLFSKIKKITFLSSFFVLLLFNTNKLFSASLAIELGRIKARLSELTINPISPIEKVSKLITLINEACRLLKLKQDVLKRTPEEFSLDDTLFTPVLKCSVSISNSVSGSDSEEISSELSGELGKSISSLEEKINSLGRESDKSECMSFARQVETSCSCFSSRYKSEHFKELLFDFVTENAPELLELIIELKNLDGKFERLYNSIDIETIRTQLETEVERLKKLNQNESEALEKLANWLHELLKEKDTEEKKDDD